MNLFLRILKRIFLILAVLVAAVVVAGLFYVRSDSFGRLLESRAGSLLAASFRGKVALGEIDTSAWGTLTIHKLSIEYGAVTIVSVPQINLGYSLIPLLWHEVRIKVIAVDPAIDLRRESDGEWNLVKALAAKSPAAAGSSAFSFRIARFDVRKGVIEVAPQGAAGPRYRVDGADLDANLTIAPAGLKAEVTEVRGRVAAPALPPMHFFAALSYSDESGSAKVSIGNLRLTTEASSVSIRGSIDAIQTVAGDLAITIDKAASSDLSAILPGYPLREDISGRVSLRGDLKTMHTEAVLAAGHARLRVKLQADLTHKAPLFDGDVSLVQLDLKTLTLAQNLTGVLDATVKARGEGTDLRALLAKTQVTIQELRVASTDAGNVELTAGAANGKVQFDGNLNRASQRLNLSGSAVVIGNPRFDIVATTKHLNAAAIVRTAPPTDISSRTIIQGSGHDPKTFEASIHFRAADSAVARVPVSSEVRARLRAGRVDIAQANILSQGAIVSIKGTAGVVPGVATRLSYQVNTDRIAPWLELAGTTGDGGFALEGTASGRLRGAKGVKLRTQGEVGLRSIRLSDLRIASGSAKYSLEGIGTDGWPRGGVDLQFTALRTNGIKLHAIAARAGIDRGPRVSLAMTAYDENNKADRLAMTVLYRPDRIAGSLDRLDLALSDGTWHLVDQGQFTKDQHRITVSHFALANGARRLALDADVSTAGAQQAAVLRAHAIELEVLRPLMPQKQRIAGELSAEIMIGGTSTAPSIESNLAVKGLTTNGQRLGDINATATYRSSSAALDVTLHQDQSHQLRISGGLPVNLDWSHGFAATIGNNQKIRVYSTGMRLAPFAGVAPRTLRDAVGSLQADLELSGPPLHPAIKGTMAITGAGGDIVPLGIRLADLEMRLLVTPARLEIVELSAKAADGTLNGNGSVALGTNYSLGAIAATFRAHRWPAIATTEYNAIVDGELRAGGTLGAPLIQGQIDVVDTTIHPDLDLLSGSAVPPPDSTIAVVRLREESSPASQEVSSSTSEVAFGGASVGQQADNPKLKNLAIDVEMTIHRNTWIRHENARVELDGHVRIEKRRDGPISMVGEIDMVRGWLQFHGKRFTLANGQILFTGGSKIDPSLNIDAQYAVSDYTIDVIVAGTASKPEIKLQSQPQLAQADILSLILFGTTSAQLSQREKTTLRQQAQSLAVGAAGRALSESLGLASLGVDVNGGSIGLGHYLNKDTYISVSPSLGAKGSQPPVKVAAIEYFLMRWLTITTATMSDGSRQIFLKVSKRY